MLDMFMAGKRIYLPAPNPLQPYRPVGGGEAERNPHVRVPLLPPEPGPKILMYMQVVASNAQISFRIRLTRFLKRPVERLCVYVRSN